MTEGDDHIGWLGDARLAAHALSPSPVWLWRADASRILWANPVAAAVFDAASPAAATQIAFAADHPAAQQIARLADTLPEDGTAQLERLHGFGGSLGGPLMCLCSRFTPSDHGPAVLVVATETAGPKQTLLLRAQRLLHDFAAPAALFSADGELVAANGAARAVLGEMRDLAALGAADLAREAARNDRAEGEIAAGPVRVVKLAAGSAFLLLLLLPQAAARPADNEAQSVRFVWHMDVSNRFTQGLEDFTRLLGPKTAAVLLIEPWPEAAQILQLDPGREIAQALAARHTWSGVVLDWPVDGTDQRLPIELSGLPVFDRDRQFAGFRGFAICRDIEKSAAYVQPAPPAETAPILTPGEQTAFAELGRELTERLNHPAAPSPLAESAPEAASASVATPVGEQAADSEDDRAILDKLPLGLLVYRLDSLLYANRAFLEWTGYRDLEALREAGGLDSLFIETAEQPAADVGKHGRPLTIATGNGTKRAAAGRLFSVTWGGETALMLTLATHESEAPAPSAPPAPPPASDERAARLEAENRELQAIVNTATDGVLILDRIGRVASANRSAQALFGMDAAGFSGKLLVDLFAHESKLRVLDYLDRVARGNGAVAPENGREMIGRVHGGGQVPLALSIGRLGDSEKLCVVLRDLTPWKRGQETLINARRQAELASAAKSEFVAKVSHEIRTPLNAIIGFAEVMMEERFGPIGNDRYRQYLKDIQASGAHLISLINDLLDLSKIEAGKLDLTFANIDLNELTQQCVAMMQPQANRERVIMRSALASGLPPVTADARSVRQIALNLLSNSIKFTGAGGQVIVSTALNDNHEVVLRVRDTGHGMTEEELETALEPFRQVAAASATSGTGLGLPITKALAEANHARFHISSRVDNGTLVEVAFQSAQEAAQ